ncbi:alanine dehydrogenase [Microbacterium endophyticum]|uniref:Alanine dehydrogenase n=1 Tax=Microbacterium endophyticum TaxID=1526412 RepID=A0A7W4YNJ8_9MICO|nr:alanine dehydrogenase [Microbacterium endophyticum]MBB2975761.1 alanine dehydrogenase [Microbacterium endophyticum]NIK36244.1 alanine dehydrogenase [Microbacterium endophyticum]
MKIGIPTELKNSERRVAITPEGVDTLVRRGHDVLIEKGAGAGARLSDEAYLAAGAQVTASADEVWAHGDLLLKVKEPIAPEFARMRADQVLFTYLHLAASVECANALLQAGTTAIAYETVQTADRKLPLLAPMSEIAGRLAVLAGAHHLMSPMGGRGTLLGGIAGARAAKVVVLGGGVAGEHAIRNAVGMGADVTVLDLSLPRLRELQAEFGPALRTRVSSPLEIAAQVSDADLVIGAVLVPGATAPRLVTTDMVATMPEGSVLVDIAIDQGGCFEGSAPTTYSDPTFAVHGSQYYCVANMPGAVPETATRALTNATLPYVIALADKGWRDATHTDPALAAGLNTHAGFVTNAPVAAALGTQFVALTELPV